MERAFWAEETANAKALGEDVRKNKPNEVRAAGRGHIRSHGASRQEQGVWILLNELHETHYFIMVFLLLKKLIKIKEN